MRLTNIESKVKLKLCDPMEIWRQIKVVRPNWDFNGKLSDEKMKINLECGLKAKEQIWTKNPLTFTIMIWFACHLLYYTHIMEVTWEESKEGSTIFIH